MTVEPRWISKAAALAIHGRLVAEHGGPAGVRDEGLLDAALAAPRNHFAYERSDPFLLAAIYAHGLTRNHPFADGNKRVALTLAGVFLELNGYRLAAPEPEAVSATVALSDRSLGAEGFAEWLRSRSVSIRRGREAAGGGSRRARGRRPPPKR